MLHENTGVGNLGEVQLVHRQLFLVGHLRAEHGPQFFQAAGGLILQNGVEPVVSGVEFQHGPLEQLFLGFKMVVDRTLGHTQCIDDILHGGLLVAILQKQADRRIQYFFYRLFRILISRHDSSPLIHTVGM